MDQTIIRGIPKVELHCHLDGSVSVEAFHQISGEAGNNLVSRLTAPVPCNSLKQYLTCFDVVLPFLQTEQALETAAYDVIRQAANDHIVYMEVRFAPGLHGAEGLNEIQACNAVLKGLERGETDFGVRSRALVCMMRGQDQAFNQRTLNAARELRDYGVAGLDLAGNEAAFPPEIYTTLLEQAARYDIPVTLHAGECGSSENVRRSVELGARRIGHGVAIADDESVKELCRKNRICLEMCPGSNLQTKAFPDIDSYPFLRMRNEGLCTTLHTDNRTVSGTTLTDEWALLANHFEAVDEQLIRVCSRDAAEASFLPYNEKQKVLQALQA